MIKNRGHALAVLLIVVGGGCDRAHAAEPEAFQGVIEHDEIRLAFEVGGRLDDVLVAPGAEVGEGETLATLDDSLASLARDARAAEVRAAEAQLGLLRQGARPEEIRGARAELRAARAAERLLDHDFARQRQLAARGAAPAAQLDSLEAQLSQATAQRQALEQRTRLLEGGARTQEIDAALAAVDAAHVALDVSEETVRRHTLESALDATVIEVHAEPGEVVAPGAPIATVADLHRPYADVFVPQARIQRVRAGAQVRVRVDSLNESLSGEVETIGRRTEFTPRFLFSERERPNLVIRVRIRIEDPDGGLHAGLPAFVTLVDP